MPNPYPNRTEDEQLIIEELYCLKQEGKFFKAYCTSDDQLTLSEWNGHHPVENNMFKRVIGPGVTLKIVMVSRLGDFGVTDDLSARYGYQLRLPWDTDQIRDIRWDAR